MQNSKATLCLCLAIANHIGVCHSSCGHKLFLAQSFHCVQTVSKTGCQFKFHIFSGGEHLYANFLGDFLVIDL